MVITFLLSPSTSSPAAPNRCVSLQLPTITFRLLFSAAPSFPTASHFLPALLPPSTNLPTSCHHPFPCIPAASGSRFHLPGLPACSSNCPTATATINPPLHLPSNHHPAPSSSPRADIIVRGYGGYNTRWALFLLHRIFPMNCTGAPAVTTVFFGANDAVILGRTSEKQHVPIEEYKQNLRNIVHHLKDCSSTMLIILITPPPVDENGRDEYARFLYGDKARLLTERTNEMTGVYANNCIELAQELNLPCVDLWSLMQKTAGWQKKFLRDGLHLTPEGNEVVHKEVLRVLLDAGLSPQDLPYDFPHHSDIDGKEPHKAFKLKN